MVSKVIPYGSKWRSARLGFLNKHPYCEDCEKHGMVVLATVVDHKIPHKNDFKLFWDRKNWQGLCKHCHDSHKQRLERSGLVVGCDVSGFPDDPNHHWRKG